jgi:hypothetical protein
VGDDAEGLVRIGARIQRTRDGAYRLRLSDPERGLLRSLPGQLRALVARSEDPAGDPVVERLFPAAHPDDPELDAEYRSLVRDHLVEDRLSAVEVLEATVDATELDEEQATAWLKALNDARLALGVRLGVTEEMTSHHEEEAFAVYQYLGWLLAQLVDALGGGLEVGGEA